MSKTSRPCEKCRGSRIYHYDTTYEQEAEDGTVTASVELRIYFTVTPAGGDEWNEPRYNAQAEFYAVSEEVASTKALSRWQRDWRPLSPCKGILPLYVQEMADDTLYRWAWDFVDDHQSELLIHAGEDDEAALEYAAEMRDAARREMRL